MHFKYLNFPFFSYRTESFSCNQFWQILSFVFLNSSCFLSQPSQVATSPTAQIRNYIKNYTVSNPDEFWFYVPSAILTDWQKDRWDHCCRGVMVEALDCRIVVCEFELQSRYYVHFRTNTLGKAMNPLILPAIG